MASYVDDPSQWRLRSNSNIPYRFLGCDGGFTNEAGEVTYKLLIKPNQLISFLTEIFPPPLQFGTLSVPQSAPLPGLPTLRARRLTFKSHDSGKPIDPFGFDSSAPDGTYHGLAEIDIEFGPLPTQEPKVTDPTTFLEISGTTSGEFLHSPMPKAKWLPRTNPDVTDGEDEEPGSFIDSENDEVGDGGQNPDEGTPEPNRDPNLPATILVPMTEWSLKWNQIPYQFFRDVLIHRLRFLMGRVNTEPVPVLFNALPGTLLFAGFSYSNSFTWRDGYVGTPPVSLDIKVVEKRVIWKGVICGHNEFWRPGVGWETLLHDGENKVFRGWDYNRLFLVGN